MDWAGEYGGLGLEPVSVKDLSLEGLTPSDITDAFQVAFSLTTPQASMLLRVAEGARTIGDIARALRGMAVRGASEAEIRGALLRRIAPLESLRLFEGRVRVEQLLSRRVRVDLSPLPFEARRLAANIVLRLLYNAITTRGTPTDRAVIVVEEAQNVMPPRRPEQPPSGGEVIVNELRKHGVSVIAIAQAPSQVQPEAWRNAEYVVLHRCKLSPLEAQYLHLDADQVERAARLPTGRAMVLHRGRARGVLVARPLRPTKGERRSSELDELRRRLEGLEAKVGEPSRLSEVDSRLSELEGEVKRSLLETSALKEWLHKLEGALKRLDEAVGSLRGSADAHGLKGAIEGEISSLRSSLEELRGRLDRVEERLSVVPDIERIAGIERRLSEVQGELKVVRAALARRSRRLAERVRRVLADYGLEDLVDISVSLGEVILVPRAQGADQRIQEALTRHFDVERCEGGWVVHGVKDRRA